MNAPIMPSFYIQMYWANNSKSVYCLLHVITFSYNSAALLVPSLWSNGAVGKLRGRADSLFSALLIKLLYRCESSINTDQQKPLTLKIIEKRG